MTSFSDLVDKQSRSAVHFVIFLAFAVSAALFVINIAAGTVDDINAIGDSPIFVPERYAGGAWETYSNQKYGFTIKYPGGWDVSTNPGDSSYLAMTFSDPNQRVNVIFPSFSLGIAVPGLRCDTAVSNKEFRDDPALVIGDTEYFRTCLNFSVAKKKAIAICDFIRSNKGFIRTCNKIFNSIGAVK